MKFTCIDSSYSLERFNLPGNYHSRPVKRKLLNDGDTYEGELVEIGGKQMVKITEGVFPLAMFNTNED